MAVVQVDFGESKDALEVLKKETGVHYRYLVLYGLWKLTGREAFRDEIPKPFFVSLGVLYEGQKRPEDGGAYEPTSRDCG